MTYLADSDVVASWLFGIHNPGTDLAVLRRAGLSISMITYMEIYEGIIGTRNRTRHQEVYRTFLRGIRLIVVSRPIAERAAEIRLDLRDRPLPIDRRSRDLLVAATALHHDLALVTGNRHDYADTPNLRFYSG